MKFLFLDLETTGVNVEEDRITEICVALWDSKSQEILRLYNTLVKPPDLKSGFIKDETIELNGITEDMVSNHGVFTHFMFWDVLPIIREADYIVAHFGNVFDKPLFHNEIKRFSQQIVPEGYDKHWIDTSIDVPYPSNITTRKLVHLAAEHGFLNPFPHRAFGDVLSMLRIVEQYDPQEIVNLSMIRNVKLIADVQKPWLDGGVSRDKAKEHGFKFDYANKLWVLVVKEDKLASLKSKFEFGVKEEFL